MAASRASEDVSTSESTSSLLRCPSCGHDNPQGSNFCNQCGAPVHFRVCEACQAINDVSAYTCHKCHRSLVPASPEVPSVFIEKQDADTRDQPTRQNGLLIALIALVVLTVVLFFAYQDYWEPIEPVAFVYFEPTAMQVDAQIAIDANADATLTGYTQAPPPITTTTNPVARKPAASKSKARNTRSSRAS